MVSTAAPVVNGMNIPGTFEVYDIETGQWASTCTELKEAEATAAHLNKECGENLFTWTFIPVSTPTGWLKVGELVRLGRFGHTYEVVEATRTSESDLFSHQAARETPMIYRFRNLSSGTELCLSHSGLTEEELQSRR
jgi:hypothetical protein